MSDGLSILYVEDNIGDAVLLQEAFAERASQVKLLVLPDGDQALHYLKMKETARDAPPPHAIILDGHLPRVSGRELLAFIRSSDFLHGIPHLLFLEERECAKASEEFGLEPERCVQKPTDWDGLLALVDSIIKLIERTRKR